MKTYINKPSFLRISFFKKIENNYFLNHNIEQTEENIKEFAVAKRVIIKYRRVLVFHLKSNSSLYKFSSNELIFSFFKIFAKAKQSKSTFLNCSWFVAHL